MWGIERRPDLHGVAAYVSTSDSVDNNSATYAAVPAILFTSTRPTNPVTGTHWSDPTTKKSCITLMGSGRIIWEILFHK